MLGFPRILVCAACCMFEFDIAFCIAIISEANVEAILVRRLASHGM